MLCSFYFCGIISLIALSNWSKKILNHSLMTTKLVTLSYNESIKVHCNGIKVYHVKLVNEHFNCLCYCKIVDISKVT